ncbi:MAG TPA: DnaT-like ssDNA-binding protein [Steroidobacter sp.]|uniref:DnaT-like ssDNA-binding protein n=1 Tax=Steroidobacter sp. TaxID=1978227 RepID=UPI002ED83434
MALVIEDGTGRADAQSYASVETLRAYAKARGETVPGGNSDCEALLMKAMDYMRGKEYVGDRATKEQALDWPRVNVVVEGFPYASTELPRQVEQAQCALAIAAQRVDLLPNTPANTSGPISERTVGPITTKYSNTGRVSQVPAIAKADVILRTILKRNGLFAVRA